ncbi:hypothetical protein AVEN_150129-1 [Araneus ventricosus]|uniref:Uncharacterized protein n=1 Tax=Araneus ventricosus TaxID=182803 RepID=A0A4Y2TA50_ARAVE|nr:hypothetical protein AVEN_150129-1 [Araneus ventricosus]
MVVYSSHVKGCVAWPDGVSASVHSSAAEIFGKPRSGVFYAIGRNSTDHKYEPRATRGLPSHTALEQGLMVGLNSCSFMTTIFYRSRGCSELVWSMRICVEEKNYEGNFF